MKVLFYCCEFAPEGKTGVIRPSKFAKNFIKNDVDVKILTKKIDEMERVYDDLLEELDEDLIERVRLRKFLPINDDGFWFVIFSFFSLIRKVQKDKPDFIFISVPVFLPLLNVYLVSKIMGVKYVVDYRDLWAGDPYPVRSLKDRILRSVARLIEPAAMRGASITTFVSENMLKDQELLYGDISNSFVLSTGFDKADIAKIRVESVSKYFPKGKRVYCHIGMLDLDMNVVELIGLIKKFSKNKDVLFMFVGGKNGLIRKLFRDEGIDHVCLFVDQVDKITALSIAKRADGLVILGSGSTQRLNRKVFESIAVSDNIFYYGNRDSPTAEVLTRNGFAVFDSRENMESIFSGFVEFCSGVNARSRIPENLNLYEKEQLSLRYIERMAEEL